MEIRLLEFQEYMKKVRGASENTIQSYLRDLRGLLHFFAVRGILRPEQVSPPDLLGYLEILRKEGKSAATVSRTIASVRAFFSWMTRTGILERNPAETLHAPKVVRKTTESLPEDALRRLLAQPEEKSAKGIRDRAMLELLYAAGFGVSELCALTLLDLDTGQQLLTVRGQKNLRRVHYGRRTGRYLRRYLEEARPKLLCGAENASLFVSCRGQAMSRQGFWKLCRQYGAAAGIERELLSHGVRHCFSAEVRNTQ